MTPGTSRNSASRPHGMSPPGGQCGLPLRSAVRPDKPPLNELIDRVIHGATVRIL